MHINFLRHCLKHFSGGLERNVKENGRSWLIWQPQFLSLAKIIWVGAGAICLSPFDLRHKQWHRFFLKNLMFDWKQNADKVPSKILKMTVQYQGLPSPALPLVFHIVLWGVGVYEYASQHVWDQFVCVWQLNNRLFEELAMDVYDEVDRRENDAGEPLSSSSVCFSLGWWGLYIDWKRQCPHKTPLTWEKERKRCRENWCLEDRVNLSVEKWVFVEEGQMKWGRRRRDAVRKSHRNSWGAFLLLLGSVFLSFFCFFSPLPSVAV